MAKIKERIVDLDGAQYVALVRHDQDGSVYYAFDGGEQWRSNMVEAFTVAKTASALIPYREPSQSTGGGEFEAWVVTLLAEIKDMGDGETLRVSRYGGNYLLRREKVVGACSVTAFRDVDLRMEEEGGGGAGRSEVQGRGHAGGGDRDGQGAGREGPPG